MFNYGEIIYNIISNISFILLCTQTLFLVLFMLTCFMYTMTQGGRYYYCCHWRDDKTNNTQTGLVISPKTSLVWLSSDMMRMREPGFDVRQVGSRAGVICHCAALLL